MGLLVLKVLLVIAAAGAALLVNLLDYVTRDGRTRRFKRMRRTLFITSGISLFLGIIVIIYDDIENERKFQRLSQPIRDVFVSFIVGIPIDHPALQPYRQRLEQGIVDVIQSRQQSSSRSWTSLKYDLYAVRRTAHGKTIDSFGIPPRSELFPQRSSEALAYILLSFIGVQVEFYKGYSTYSPNLSNPDFKFYGSASADRPNTTTGAYTHLFYEITNSRLISQASNIPCPPENWSSNNRILSIPDLSESLMMIWFHTTESANDSHLNDIIREITQSITIDSITIQISGRRFTFSQDKFQQYDRADGRKLGISKVYVVGPGGVK